MSDKSDKSLEELIEANLRLEAMINNVGAYIYSKDINGCYTYANNLVLDLFNCSLEELLGKDDSHFFDLSLSQAIKENDQQVLLHGKVIEVEETNFIKGNHEPRIYKVVKTPLYFQDKIVGMSVISTDITEDKLLQKTLNENKKLLNAVLDNVDAYIYMKDKERRFLYVNSNVANIFGLPAQDIIGKLDSEVVPQDVADHFWESDKLVFESNQRHTIEEELKADDGKMHRYLSVKIPYQSDKETPSIIGFSTDITELYQLKEEFRKQANSDPLTGLYNRRYFVEQAEKEFHRAKRYNLSLSLLSLDIDHFKKINDKYGHPVGDSVLIQLTQNLLPSLRNEDVLARIGGEEFSILLPEISAKQAKLVAERIRCEQESNIIQGDWDGDITALVSIGVATLSSTDETFDELFSRADKALYVAKNTGRNQTCFLD